MQRSWMFLLPLALLACDKPEQGGVPAALEAEKQAIAQREAAEQERLSPIRDEVQRYLANELLVKPEIRERILANLGTACTVLVDPGDPEGCTGEDGNPFTSCRSMLLIKEAGAWSLREMGMGAAFQFPGSCHIGVTMPPEYRSLKELHRWDPATLAPHPG